LFAVGEYVMRFRSRFNRSGIRAERWSLTVVMGAVVGGLVAGIRLAFWHAAAIVTGSLPLFFLGLVLMTAGIIVRHWAIITLGRFFIADVRVHSDQVVVERGPCRRVCHLSYTGLITFLLGLGLALSIWASLVVLALVPTAGLVVRIRAQERALLAGLGEPYERFIATRSHLFPGVW